jgi:hypothetical protein
VEAQADVVGDPVAVGVANHWFEQSYGLAYGLGAIGGIEAVEDAVAEGVEPVFHAAG